MGQRGEISQIMGGKAAGAAERMTIYSRGTLYLLLGCQELSFFLKFSRYL